MKKLKIFMVAGAAAMLSSCDLSQIPGLDGKLSIEDSKAIGAACRHSGRALEDCFALNPKSHHAGVFEGWREMNDYMVANEIETVKPEIQPSTYKPGGAPAAGSHSSGGHESSDKTTSEAAAPQSRQRWAPKAPGDANAAAPEPVPAAPSPPPVAAAPVPAVPPAAAVAPDGADSKPDAKSRPWERKKDPKKHT